MLKCLKIYHAIKKWKQITDNFLKVILRNKVFYNFLMVYLIFNELCKNIGVPIYTFDSFLILSVFKFTSQK